MEKIVCFGCGVKHTRNGEPIPEEEKPELLRRILESCKINSEYANDSGCVNCPMCVCMFETMPDNCDCELQEWNPEVVEIEER